MLAVTLEDASDLDAWRAKARSLLLAEVDPADVEWRVGAGSGLFGSEDVMPPARRTIAPAVPRAFLGLAGTVLAHRDPRRHATLYRMLWRIAHGERELLRIATDEDVAWAHTCARQVNRDMH
ncbi:MAG: hypothetical protein ACTHOL_13865, partial [Luteibacter jiangsuensis]